MLIFRLLPKKSPNRQHYCQNQYHYCHRRRNHKKNCGKDRDSMAAFPTCKNHQIQPDANPYEENAGQKLSWNQQQPQQRRAIVSFHPVLPLSFYRFRPLHLSLRFHSWANSLSSHPAKATGILACILALQIRMPIRGRFRPCIQSIRITDPIGSVEIDPAPLMGPLILVHMLIRITQHIQTQSRGSRASGA